MDIWQTDKLVLFIAFVVPGFVALKTYELLIPRAPRESAQQLIDAVQEPVPLDARRFGTRLAFKALSLALGRIVRTC
jgi:hypothetical protein